MLIIDTHVHVGDTWEEPIETILYQMDTNGVSHAVLAQLNGHYDNTYLLECVRRYPDRLKAIILLDPLDKSRAKTLEQLKKQGASGMRINLRDDWDNDDVAFKAAGELGMIVSMIGNSTNFASAKFKKLLDNFPNTQFCLEHMGRSAKPGVDFAEPPHDGFKDSLACAKWPNTTIKVPGLGEIVKRPSRFPAGAGTLPFSEVKIPPLYDMAKEAYGVKRMMWASNFPPCAALEGYRHALQWVREYPGFQNGDDIEWIMGKTAAKYWGFSS